MAEQSDCARLTRAAKKRAVAEMAEEKGVRKKRVVLGELTNTSNVVPPVNPSSCTDIEKQKRGVKMKVKKVVTKTAAEKNSIPPAVIDIDEGRGDPQMCGPYDSDIYEHLHRMEVDPKRRPLPDYIAKVQKDINANMRGILVDWLVEVADEYKLISDTLYLSICYIDRYLSVHSLNRQKLQLLGVSAMLIASKYEEITPPHVEEFCFITDNTYTNEEVVKMEADILKSLNFELGNPTTKSFLRIFAKVDQDDNNSYNLHLEFLGYYLAELSLLDYNCLKFLPSLVAASSIFVARFIIQPKTHPWTRRFFAIDKRQIQAA